MTNYIEDKEERLKRTQELRIKLNLAGMDQTDIAFRAKVSRTTLWFIRKSKTLPSIEVINRIEEVLNE